MFQISFSSDASFEVSFDNSDSLTATFKNTVEKETGEFYTGDYEITPTDETQTLATEGLISISDIVINPIPSNYGLITWNGSYLTVS